MPFDQNRYNEIVAAALTARVKYNALVARVPAGLKQSERMVLSGRWIDDIETTILRAASVAVENWSEAKWLWLAELLVQQVTMLLEWVAADIDRSGGPGN